MANKKHKDVSKPFKWKHAVGEIILWLVSGINGMVPAYFKKASNEPK